MEMDNEQPFARQRSAHPGSAAAGKVMRIVEVAAATAAAAEVPVLFHEDWLPRSG
jgi:hypothetical protein